ncbi:hypothetical protein [Flavitalea sp.]|nr:hypothetical protein [Flavitalea sp.]
MNKFQVYISTVALLLTFAACKKGSPADPVGTVKNFTIDLDTNYTSGKKIDSAFATWTNNGQLKTVKLAIEGNKLISSMAELSPGTGEMKIAIYSNVKFVYFQSLWLQTKTLTVKTDEEIKLKGPSGFNDQDWLPRVILHNTAMKIDAEVGMRPTDPYFFVKQADKNYREIWFSREYWKTKQGLQFVAGGVWECKSNCLNEYGDVKNEEFFKFLPNQVGTKAWNHIEIVLRYIMDQNGGGYLIDMNYDLPG